MKVRTAFGKTMPSSVKTMAASRGPSVRLYVPGALAANGKSRINEVQMAERSDGSVLLDSRQFRRRQSPEDSREPRRRQHVVGGSPSGRNSADPSCMAGASAVSRSMTRAVTDACSTPARTARSANGAPSGSAWMTCIKAAGEASAVVRPVCLQRTRAAQRQFRRASFFEADNYACIVFRALPHRMAHRKTVTDESGGTQASRNPLAPALIGDSASRRDSNTRSVAGRLLESRLRGGIDVFGSAHDPAKGLSVLAGSPEFLTNSLTTTPFPWQADGWRRESNLRCAMVTFLQVSPHPTSAPLLTCPSRLVQLAGCGWWRCCAGGWRD